MTKAKNGAKSFPSLGHEQQSRGYPIGWLITDFASAYYCIKNSTLKQTHFILMLTYFIPFCDPVTVYRSN